MVAERDRVDTGREQRFRQRAGQTRATATAFSALAQ